MWLLDTEHISLRHFDKPPSRYAILSHVWQVGEAKFPTPGSAPLRHTPKIRECCKYAHLQGFQWVWVDTCCINKTDSVELSEAINSMYKWYANATVCFAYLYDVNSGEDPTLHGSSFRGSVWFTRGWTLQELIAPKAIVFFSSDWKILGSKDFLADLLEDITGIEVGVLTSHTPLSSVSVAKRLSWASPRNTTRVEDAAYSLMGLFDIHMPTIYGEGRRAFRRLQEEIMRTSPDHTLFTWGPSFMPRSPTQTIVGPSNRTLSEEPSDNRASLGSRLLALSTSAFVTSPGLPAPTYIPHNDFKTSLKALNRSESLSGSTPDQVR